MAGGAGNNGGGRVASRSAMRAIKVLEVVAAQAPVSLAELTRTLGVPKSSLHAIATALIQSGWLDQDDTGRYRLGLRTLVVGTTYIDRDLAVEVSRPAMDWLAEGSGETIHLARLDGTDVVYLAKRESVHPLRMFSAIGRRLPAYRTGVGKAILASLPDSERAAHIPDRLEASTPRTLTDHDELFAELDKTRRRGYAIDDEQSEVGLTCFAVALHPYTGTYDSLSCTVPVARLDAQREKALVEMVLEAGRRVQASLAGRR